MSEHMTERDLIHEGWRLAEIRERNIDLFGAPILYAALAAVAGTGLGLISVDFLSGDIPRVVAGEKEEGV